MHTIGSLLYVLAIISGVLAFLALIGGAILSANEDLTGLDEGSGGVFFLMLVLAIAGGLLAFLGWLAQGGSS
jgi:hypothetical protein